MSGSHSDDLVSDPCRSRNDPLWFGYVFTNMFEYEDGRTSWVTRCIFVVTIIEQNKRILIKKGIGVGEEFR